MSDRRGPVVAHFLRTYAGSTETFVVNQIAALERYEPVVLCRGIDPRTPQSTLGPSPAPLSYSQALGPSLLGDLLYDKARISLPRERAFYRKTLDAQGAQLVHGHFGTDTAYLLKARARWGVPVVVSYYGYDVSRQPQAYGGLGVRYYRQLFREASVHLAMTPQMAEALVALGAPEERVVVHHHGIDTSHWASIDGSRRVPGRILMVARFHEKKGHDDLLQALPAVCARFPDTRLHLVGNGPLEPQLRALVERLGLSGRVVFAGFKDHAEMREEYAQASLFVHPSKTSGSGEHEGLPGSILEAMAAGLPVVSTTHAGIPHAVVDGSSGLLVPERDPSALAEALCAMLGDPEACRVYGETGRRRAQQEFDVRRQARQLESIYDGAFAMRNGAAA